MKQVSVKSRAGFAHVTVVHNRGVESVRLRLSTFVAEGRYDHADVDSSIFGGSSPSDGKGACPLYRSRTFENLLTRCQI